MGITTVEVPNDQHYEIIEWLRANIGPGGYREPSLDRWGDLWGCTELDTLPGPGTLLVKFVNEADATMFKLKWL